MDGFDGARVWHLGPCAADMALHLMKDKRSRAGPVTVLARQIRMQSFVDLACDMSVI